MTAGSMQRVATLVGPMTTRVTETKLPEVGDGQVRIRLQGCGLCASSLALWEGRPWFEYPRAAGSPGHEGWGIVDAVGSGVHDFQPGERVAFVAGHSFADYDVAPRDCVVRLPIALHAEPFPGEPLGCAMNIFERSEIESRHAVAIVGAGFLGLLLAQLSAKAGASVTVMSRRTYALDLAVGMGADRVVALDGGERDRERAMQPTEGRGYDRVIEAVGLQSTLDIASAITAERGRLIIAGYHQDGLRQVDMQQWNWRGIDVINAHERAGSRYAAGMQHAIAAVLDGRLDPFPLLTHSVALDALDRGFDLVRTRPPGFMKAVMLNEVAA